MLLEIYTDIIYSWQVQNTTLSFPVLQRLNLIKRKHQVVKDKESLMNRHKLEETKDTW